MKTIRIQQLISVDAHGALSDALQALLGDKYQGSGCKRGINEQYIDVRLSDSATETDENAARQLVLTHDTSKRTPDQLERAVLTSQLESARKLYSADKLNVSTMTDSELREFVHYLILEITSLRAKLTV